MRPPTSVSRSGNPTRPGARNLARGRKTCCADGTARAGTSPLNAQKRPRQLRCAACGQPLFDADTKYWGGTGWPSFFKPMPGSVDPSEDPTPSCAAPKCLAQAVAGASDTSFPMARDTGERYCMNGVALKFEPGKKP